MDKPFILDDGNFDGLPNCEVFRFLRRNRHAKRFRLDRETTEKVRSLVEGHADLWMKMRHFAKAPFPEVFVEFSGWTYDDGREIEQLSVLCAEGKITTFNMKGPTLIGLAAYAVPQEDGFQAVPFKDEKLEPGERTTATYETVVVMAAVTEVLWLLLHQPGVVKLTGVPTKQKVVKGKLRPMRAHSVLTIDLAEKEIIRRIAQNGSRGSGVREHEVRGTWVHLRRDFSCEAHDWQRVQRDPWEPETFDCPLCGTRRVWRKDHVRGEHKRGNIFHTYEVADSRLTKKGRPQNGTLASHPASRAGGVGRALPLRSGDPVEGAHGAQA